MTETKGLLSPLFVGKSEATEHLAGSGKAASDQCGLERQV